MMVWRAAAVPGAEGVVAAEPDARDADPHRAHLAAARHVHEEQHAVLGQAGAERLAGPLAEAVGAERLAPASREVGGGGAAVIENQFRGDAVGGEQGDQVGPAALARFRGRRREAVTAGPPHPAREGGMGGEMPVEHDGL